MRSAPAIGASGTAAAVGALALVAAGASLAYLLHTRAVSWDQVFRGYHVPADTLDDRPVRWARAPYSKIDIHDDGSRPIDVSVALVSPPSVPGNGLQVMISVNDLPIRRVDVGRSWQEVTFAVPERALGRPLSVQFDTGRISADGRGLGVGDVAVESRAIVPPTLRALLAGGLAGALLWLVTPGLESGRRRIPAAARRIALASGWRTAVIAVATLLLLPAPLPALSTAAHLALQLALLLVPGWLLLARFVRPRVPEMTLDHVALLGLPVTCLAASLALLVLQAAGAPPLAFSVTVAAGYGAVLWVAASSRDARRVLATLAWQYRHLWLLCLLVPLAALSFLTVGLGSLSDMQDWTRAANRGLHVLPVDNHLSWLMSETWRHSLPANELFFDIWSIGDRGPLYALLHSFFSRALEPGGASYASYVRLGALLNALYVAPLGLWIYRRSGSGRIATAVVVLVALNPWFFLNTYFTWPKLFGTYFLLSAVILLWDEDTPTSYHYLAAGGLFGLGILTHASHALSFPVFFLFTMAKHVRSRADAARALVMPAAIAATQIPWLIYKQLHSPETFNIVTMNYLDGERIGGYGEPLLDNVRRFLEIHPWPVQITTRIDQLQHLWWNGIQTSEIVRFWTGSASGRALYEGEFFHPLHAAGVLWLLVLLPVAALVTAGRIAARDGSAGLRRTVTLARARHGRRLARMGFVLAFACVGLSFNALLTWGPPIPHELPYVEPLLIAAIGALALRALGVAYWLIALGAIVVRHVYYFQESARISALQLPPIDAHGMHFWALLAVMALLPFAVSDGWRQPSASDATADGATRRPAKVLSGTLSGAP